MQMHRAVMLLPLAHSAAPLPLPCGLFIISVPLPQIVPSLLCGVDIRGTQSCSEVDVSLCVCVSASM